MNALEKKLAKINAQRDELTALAHEISAELRLLRVKHEMMNLMEGLSLEQKANLQAVVADGIGSEESVKGLR